MIMTTKSHKTPLRYPGGKSRALSKLFQFIPNLSDYTEYREPFLGGGSVAIEVSKRYPHLKIWVNDLYEPLYNFWRQIQNNGEEIKDKLIEYKSLYPNPDTARELFVESKELVNDQTIDSLDRAARFYIVNKCSFSGLTESSSFSQQASISNFSLRGIEKLPGYQEIITGWNINQYSYEYLMREDIHDGIFMYLDPPYDIKDNLYGKKGSMHNGFNHDDFAADCDRFIGHQLISYNSSQLVKDRFKDYQTGEFDLTYTMRSVGEYMREQKERKELLLFNYGTEGLAEFYQSNKEESD